ncbi:uncharacterized protein LOC117305146 isoform X2 [Asterias rubens]|uniref:uncharacterized protein LOC117305146 isoform X2 n=1 Tax=Asterias rubens TaxID=7604 RepID=UPI001454E775|nr:uncharacterized protein LOC117305146 isoform X2 [Asterias rubens]
MDKIRLVFSTRVLILIFFVISTQQGTSSRFVTTPKPGVPTTKADEETKPEEESANLVLIVVLSCLGVIIIILCLAIARLKLKDRNQSFPDTSNEETTPINQGQPINIGSCKYYKQKNVIQKGGKKKKSRSADNFSCLRLMTVAGNGDLVMLDGEGIRVMSKEYTEKSATEKWQEVLSKYVAMAASKRQAGEVLVARKSGKISWRDNSSGNEVEIQGCSSQSGEISDMDVDDMGTTYVADIVKNVIYSYSVDGSFKSAFAVKDSPKCISACEGGILYVLSGSRIKRGEGYDIEGGTIKRYTNGTRGDYDIKCPTDMNIVTAGLYSSKTSVYVLTKSAGPDKAEASAILQFSALDGLLQRRIIDEWPGILGIVFIRDDDELAFFDSKEVQVYEKQK